MASIEKLESGLWQAQVRMNGVSDQLSQAVELL